MKIFKLLLSYPLFLALVVVPRVAEAQSVLPFKSTIAITESLQPGTLTCFLIGNISGTGLASHLGKITLVSSDCINPINETGTAFSFFSNQVVLSVPNGDQIIAAYNGILTSNGTVGVISGGYQIVGGTGRYAQATGAGTVQGAEDFLTGAGSIQLTGTISY